MEERKTLNKTLKAHWVWAIALGSAIGWGVFVQPTTWMGDAGPLGVIIGFVIGALLMMLIAVSYGFLIKSFPISGGEFAYAYISLGRTHAFISGWFLTLGYICIVALNASAFALMIKFVFPTIIESFHLYTIAGWDVYGMEIIIASAILGIFGYFNMKGTGLSGQMQFIFASVMVAGVVLLTVLVGVQPGTAITAIEPLFPSNKTAIAAIISIVAIAPWAYVGFDVVPQAAEEFDFPARKAFTLIILALLFAAILYSFMIAATAMTGPWEELVANDYSWGTAVAMKETLGILGVIIIVIALTMGIFTGLNGFVLATSRLLFAMSRAKILPASFSKVHKKYQTPYVAVIFTVVVAMVAPWFGRQALTWVVDMSSIGVSIAYFYTCYTAFTLFKWKDGKHVDNETYAISPMKKTLSGIGIIASVIFIGLLLIPGSPAFLGIESRIALGAWIVLGVIFYLLKRKEFNKIPKEELNYLILGEKKVTTEDE